MAKEKEKETKEVTLFQEFEKSKVTGFEGADFESYATPFLRILQQNSPQCLEDSDGYVRGAKPGFFFNTVTNEIYGREIEVIPVRFERIYIEWKPERQGFAGMHSIEEGKIISEPDPEKFGTRIHKETENLLQDTHTFYLLIAEKEEEGPLVFPLSSTGIKHSRKWLSTAKMIRLPNKVSAPLYSSVYKLSTMFNENDQGRWYQIGDKNKTAVERVNWITGKQFNYVKGVLSMFDAIKANIGKTAVDVAGFEETAPY